MGEMMLRRVSLSLCRNMLLIPWLKGRMLYESCWMEKEEDQEGTRGAGGRGG